MVESVSGSWHSIFVALEAKDQATAHVRLTRIKDGAAFEAHSLALHLQAHLLYGERRLEEASAALECAADLEREAGYPQSAGHTIHAVALFGNVQGDVKKVRGYYRQSLAQLEKMKSNGGMSLCLRSLGEMALALGLVDQAKTIWKRSMQHAQRGCPAEAGLVEAWLEILEESYG